MSSQPMQPHPAGARSDALLEVAESIAAHRQLSTLFADLSRLLKPLIAFDFISLTILDAKANVFRLHVLQTDREVVGRPTSDTPFDQSPTGEALRTPQTLLRARCGGRGAVPHPGKSAARQRRPVLLRAAAGHGAARSWAA